jgi:hypothetical protein
MPQPVDKGYSLHCLSKAHLIGKDDICATTPVVRKEIDTLKLEGPQLPKLDVVRLRVQLDKLPAGVRIRLAGVGGGSVRRAVKESVDLGLR